MKIMERFKSVFATTLTVTLLLTSSSAVFAAGNTSNTDIQPIMKNSSTPTKVLFKQNDLKFDKKVINDSEIHFTATLNGHKSESDVTKDANSVVSKFYLDGKLVLTKKQSLKEATDFGNNLQSANKKTVIIKDPTGDYYFDGILYSRSSTSQPYAHPDKRRYGISPYQTWSANGTQDVHVQIDEYDSTSILQSPTWAVCGGIGAIVGGYITDSTIGAVVGAIIGGALGGYYGGQVERLADENGCIWFAIDNNPPVVNLGSTYYPEYYADVRYIEVGPFSKTNYYYYLSGV